MDIKDVNEKAPFACSYYTIDSELYEGYYPFSTDSNGTPGTNGCFKFWVSTDVLD